jgi:hypothetical protein
VSPADRVDSGFGEDTSPRPQYAAFVQQSGQQLSHYQNKQQHAQSGSERRAVAVHAAQTANVSPQLSTLGWSTSIDAD